MYDVEELLYFIVKTNKSKIDIFNCDLIKYKVYDYDNLTDFIVIECYYYDKEETEYFLQTNHTETFNYFINKEEYLTFTRIKKIKHLFYV